MKTSDLSFSVHIRFTDEEAEIVKRLAAAQFLKVSAYIKRSALLNNQHSRPDDK